MTVHIVFGLVQDAYTALAAFWPKMMATVLPADVTFVPHKYEDVRDNPALLSNLGPNDVVVAHSFGCQSVVQAAAIYSIPTFIACDPVDFNNPLVPNTVGFNPGKAKIAICYHRAATEIPWSGSFIPGPNVTNILCPNWTGTGTQAFHDYMLYPYAYTLIDNQLTGWDTTKPQNSDLVPRLIAALTPAPIPQPIPMPTPTPTGTVPNGPYGLTAAPAAGNSVALNWSPNGTNQTGFLVMRSSNGSAFAQVGNVAVPQFVDVNLPPGSYQWKVIAYNAAGESSASGPATLAISGGSTAVDLTGATITFQGKTYPIGAPIG